MELRRLCAYNQTRECFLGLEVAVADLSSADLKLLLEKLALKSGEGLWMAPFRGIPEMETHTHSPPFASALQVRGRRAFWRCPLTRSICRRRK